MRKSLFFVILMTCAFLLKAQQQNRCGNFSGVNVIFEADSIIPNSTKTVICNFDTAYIKSPVYRTVSLYKYVNSNGTKVSRFILSEDDDFVYDQCSEYQVVTMPTNISVNDFVVYRDTLYFCGQRSVLNNLDFITYGFIASIPIADLFAQGADSANFIGCGYEINKLLVFPDKNNKSHTSVFATGTRKFTPEPYALPVEHLGDPTVWVIPPDEYYDFVLLHDFSSTTMHYVECPSKNTIEKIQDIAVSAGCVEFVSLKYPIDTSNGALFYTNDNYLTSQQMVYRKFSSGNLQERKTNYIDIRFYNRTTDTYFDDNTKKGIFNVKFDLLSGDNFLLSFNYYSPGYHATIVNRVRFNMGTQNSRFVNLLSSRVYEGTSARFIKDYKYIVNSQRLMLLMEDNNNHDGVYDLNLQTNGNNYFYNDTPTQMYNCTEIVPKDVFGNSSAAWSDIGSFNGIIRMKNDGFRLVGTYPYWGSDNLAFFQFVRLKTSSCHDNIIRTIKNTPFPINTFEYETSINELTPQTVSIGVQKFLMPEYVKTKGDYKCTNAFIGNIQ